MSDQCRDESDARVLYETTREDMEMPLLSMDWEVDTDGVLRPMYVEAKVQSTEKEEEYEGEYPRYRYELVDQDTGEVVESATKRRKSDRKVKQMVEGMTSAQLSHLGYYELCQEATEGPWIATLLAEGRMLLRVEKLNAGHKPKAADSFTWNEEEHMWNLTEDEELALLYAGYGMWD